VKINKLG